MPSLSNWLLLMTPCGDKLYHLAEEECMQCCSDSKSHATLFTFKAQALLLLLLLLLCSAQRLSASLLGCKVVCCMLCSIIQHMLDQMVRLK